MRNILTLSEFQYKRYGVDLTTSDKRHAFAEWIYYLKKQGITKFEIAR